MRKFIHTDEEMRIETMPLRYELLFDGDNRGWQTGIDCVLELSDMPIWFNHCINEDDRALLEKVKSGILHDDAGNHIEYHWLIDQFIDDAKCRYNDTIMRLAWVDGSIFAVPEDMNEHEVLRLYGEE